jgi:monofunctional biosynthetic peptidoglycan transglycosylase
MDRLVRALGRIAGGASSDSPSDAGWLRLPRSLRDAAELAHRDPASTGYIRYRAAQAGRAPDSPLSAWVRLDDVSPYLVCAVIRAEDPFFFAHRGIGLARIRKAVGTAVREKKPVRGVSTLTQQLARNLYLHPERSMRRKAQEAILAIWLERVLTKERILELYLNVVEWGEGVWGIGSAARAHFSWTPAELDPFQSVVLASMLPAPRRPLRDGNAKRALAGQKRAVMTLYGCGILSREEQGELGRRVLELERAIEEGVPAEEVLRASAERPLALTPDDRPEISTRGLMASACGFGPCRRLATVLREARRQRLPVELPLWWTGDLAPDPVAGATEEAAGG